MSFRRFIDVSTFPIEVCLRFTNRDLLWLTVVVALAVGWWTDVKTRRYAVGVYEDYENRINKKYSDEMAQLKRANEWRDGEVRQLREKIKA